MRYRKAKLETFERANSQERLRGVTRTADFAPSRPARIDLISWFMAGVFAEWLHAQLTLRDWRAVDAAEASGISAQTISAWIEKGTQPEVGDLRLLAAALDLPILDVLVAAGVLTEQEIEASRAHGLPDHLQINVRNDAARRMRGHDEQDGA